MIFQRITNYFRSARRPRVLCFVVHYFGPSPKFVGKSTSSSQQDRRRHVQRVLDNLRAQKGLEVNVCGISGRSLVPVDIDFLGLNNPEMLVYESLGRLADHLSDYDYFMVVEDDILVPAQVLANIMAFDREHPVNECLHPNRLEYREGGIDCVDLRAMPGWSGPRTTFRGIELCVAQNPHSGFLMLSQDKFAYGLEQTDRAFRGRFLGGYMESAFAHYHRPFLLFRPYENIEFHTIVHLDHWLGPDAWE